MEPLVSVVCTTYNHEKYIADALNGFLEQETTFPYEIIIHDDASTDKTAKIIGEYENNHSSLIKAIYQKENQYSQGIKITETHIAPKIRGKYVATCEGDDYWVDKQKLQKQFDFLEKNPEYISCFHAVVVVDTNKNLKGRYLGLTGNGSKGYTIKDMVVGGVVHASSRFTRSEYYKIEKPAWLSNAFHGDYAFTLYLSAEGKVFFIDEVMSAYRTGVENSMMTNFRKNYSRKKDIEYHNNRIETLELADEYYDYNFHDEIKKVNLISETCISLLRNDFSSLAKKQYSEFIKQYGLLSFMKIFLNKRLPRIFTFLVKVKEKFASTNIQN